MYSRKQASCGPRVPAYYGMVVVLVALIAARGNGVPLDNGDFETGAFPAWSTVGLADIQDATFGSGPPQGTFDALLVTRDNSPADGVTTDELETFLGLNSGDLAAVGNEAQESLQN